MILPDVLFGSETWYLTLWEECRLGVFENRILRQIFYSKGDDNGKWRGLRNKELRCLYGSRNIVRFIKSSTLRWQVT